VYYHRYLHLDKVLGAQEPKSLTVGGAMAHDEMLFIITHQVGGTRPARASGAQRG
jgi:tryptophan 2,3-dioxygenase